MHTFYMYTYAHKYHLTIGTENNAQWCYLDTLKSSIKQQLKSTVKTNERLEIIFMLTNKCQQCEQIKRVSHRLTPVGLFTAIVLTVISTSCLL